jgi:hypothetical protein
MIPARADRRRSSSAVTARFGLPAACSRTLRRWRTCVSSRRSFRSSGRVTRRSRRSPTASPSPRTRSASRSSRTALRSSGSRHALSWSRGSLGSVHTSGKSYVRQPAVPTWRRTSLCTALSRRRSSSEGPHRPMCSRRSKSRRRSGRRQSRRSRLRSGRHTSGRCSTQQPPRITWATTMRSIVSSRAGTRLSTTTGCAFYPSGSPRDFPSTAFRGPRH